MEKIIRVTFIVLIILGFASVSFASPFMVSNPSPGLVGGGYEIYEITTTYPDGRLAYSAKNEPDGSIRMDLNEIPVGIHKWKVRQFVNEKFNEFIPATLTVSLLYYKSGATTFIIYSESKSWTFRVPSNQLGIGK